jgi:hypothetical protein
MALDEKRFPELIRSLYQLVSELESMFPGRPFTPDGHMVGSLAECFAEFAFGLSLYKCSNKGHDAYNQSSKIEIKATQGKTISLRSEPENLLVFHLLKESPFFETVYNGPGGPVWELVRQKPKPSNGQYQVSLSQLRKLMEKVPKEKRLPKLRG